jgi:hypothetical protein
MNGEPHARRLPYMSKSRGELDHERPPRRVVRGGVEHVPPVVVDHEQAGARAVQQGQPRVGRPVWPLYCASSDRLARLVQSIVVLIGTGLATNDRPGPGRLMSWRVQPTLAVKR